MTIRKSSRRKKRPVVDITRHAFAPPQTSPVPGCTCSVCAAVMALMCERDLFDRGDVRRGLLTS